MLIIIKWWSDFWFDSFDSRFGSTRKLAESSQQAGKAGEGGEIYKDEGMVYSRCGLRADGAYRTEGHGLAMRVPGFRRRRSDGWRSYGWNSY